MKINKVLMVIAGLIAALVIILLVAKSPDQRAAMGKFSISRSVTSTKKADLYQELLQRTAAVFSIHRNLK